MTGAEDCKGETVSLHRGGVRSGFSEDIGLGLFGCVGVCCLKDHTGQREKHKQRQGDRRGLVWQGQSSHVDQTT